jgi:hypothetical protein
MVAIHIVVTTAIIIIVQVLGFCVAAPISPLENASIAFGNETASRFEKNEGATLLMRREPCFGNLCGKLEEERSPSPPSPSGSGRKERGDTFMGKVLGVIKDGWKSAGSAAGKAWDNTATGVRNAVDFVTRGSGHDSDRGTVIRTPYGSKKAGQAEAGQSNPAGPSLWTKPPGQRQIYDENPDPTVNDLAELRRATLQFKELQRGIYHDDQRLRIFGSLEHWDPEEYENAREDRIAKELEQLRIKQDTKAYTNHLKLPEHRRPAPVAAPPAHSPVPVVPLRPFTPPVASAPVSGISLPENVEPKNPATKFTKEQSPGQKNDDNVSLRTVGPPSDPLVRDAATAPVPADGLSAPGTRAQGSAAVSDDGSSRPVRSDASNSARNRSPGPRPARANVIASNPNRIPVPTSVRVPAHIVAAGNSRPPYLTHGRTIPPWVPSPPYAGPSDWYERFRPKLNNRPPPTRKGKERAPPSSSGSDDFPPDWESSAENTPKQSREGTLRSATRPLTDGAASSDASEASFYTAPGHVKRGILAERAEKILTASHCKLFPESARLCAK